MISDPDPWYQISDPICRICAHVCLRMPQDEKLEMRFPEKRLNFDLKTLYIFLIWQVFKIKWFKFGENMNLDFGVGHFRTNDFPHVRDRPLDRRAGRGAFPQ